jgi:hypothetical protein
MTTLAERVDAWQRYMVWRQPRPWLASSSSQSGPTSTTRRWRETPCPLREAVMGTDRGAIIVGGPVLLLIALRG